jgi:hypothetical protein
MNLIRFHIIVPYFKNRKLFVIFGEKCLSLYSKIREVEAKE